MAGFVDVILRGLTLVFMSLGAGGVAWVCWVLRAGPGAKPDRAVRRALRVVAAAGALGAATQAAVLLIALGALDPSSSASLGPDFLGTTFARASLARVALGVILSVAAVRLATRPGGRGAWAVLAGSALGFVASSALVSHAIARLDARVTAIAIDALHQLAAAVWVGGLAHLTLHATRARDDEGPPARLVVQRVSTLALGAVAVIVVAGVALSLRYVGDLGALVGTAYGVMVLSKVVLLVAALALGFANFRAVRRMTVTPGVRLFRFVEVELGLGITLLFAAASLTSLPPAIDVREDRATVAEVAARFTPGVPRLTSPPVDELIRTADSLMANSGGRLPIERAWSEYNHHWAGLFVVLMGLGAALERAGVRPARHWPLVFFGLGAFLFVRNDPRAWPLGPAGFWESFTLPDVLQHRVFVVLVLAFGAFEWMVRTGRLPRRPWAYVFPLLCAVAGGLLLTHSHAMFNLKDQFLVEVTHAPLGLVGAFAGWGRWLELRLPASASAASWAWIACLTGVGVLLLGYREG